MEEKLLIDSIIFDVDGTLWTPQTLSPTHGIRLWKKKLI